MSYLTQVQIPDKSILDKYNRQTYLGTHFITSIPPTTIAGTVETPLIYISNPSSNSVSLFSDVRKLTCLTASQSVLFNIYVNPTVSANGTAMTPINLKFGSSITSQAHAYENPTATSYGTFIAALASNAFTPNVSDVLLIIDPGTSLLITVTASAASTKLVSEILWYEL